MKQVSVYYFILIFILQFIFTFSVGQNIETINTSTQKANGLYYWSIFIKCSEVVLESIDYVDYELHPSFSNPEIRKENRSEYFKLNASGWGEFTITIKIHFNNGSTKRLTHLLKLGNGIQNIQNSTSNTSAKIKSGNTAYPSGGAWEWSVYISADQSVINNISYVEYTLHPTFPNPVRTISKQGNDPIKKFPLNATGWGTFRVYIKVYFKDGLTQRLFQDLIF